MTRVSRITLQGALRSAKMGAYLKKAMEPVKRYYARGTRVRPRSYFSRSKHAPHQGHQECARRREQLAKGQIYNHIPPSKIVWTVPSDPDSWA